MSRNHSIRRGIGAAIAAMAVAIVSACAGTPASAPSDSAGPAAPLPLSILVSPVVEASPIYIAQQQGIFAKHGLDVKVTQGQGGSAIAAALQSGGADIGIVNYISLFSGRANGLPLKVVAPEALGGESTAGVYVTGDSPIKTISDLKGKKIGIISKGSVSDLTTDIALKTVGLTGDDVQYVQVPFPNLLSSLENHQIDATFLDIPYTLQAEHDGARKISSAFAGESAGLPIAGYVASESWISGHADTIKAFRAALQEAAGIAANNLDLVRSLVPTFTSIPAAVAAKLPASDYQLTLTAKELQQVPDLMLEYGFLKKPIDASTAMAG